MTVVAGSNGSGKSTLTSGARSKFQQNPTLDPDAIARSLQDSLSGDASDIAAGKQVLERADALIESQQSFTVETTLSGSTYLRMASRAKTRGFNVLLFYVGTASVEINLARVRARVLKGGHDVPEDDQRRRFPRTQANLIKMLALADVALLFDNSTSQGHVLVGAGHPTFMTWFEPVPEWASSLTR